MNIDERQTYWDIVNRHDKFILQLVTPYITAQDLKHIRRMLEGSTQASLDEIDDVIYKRNAPPVKNPNGIIPKEHALPVGDN